jgi:hypothetical protein
MFTVRSILSRSAKQTATQCSAALPTTATTMMPTKNVERPIDSDASVMEPTRTSDMTPTATPAIASRTTLRRTDHASSATSSSSSTGLKRSLCVRSENSRPAP